MRRISFAKRPCRLTTSFSSASARAVSDLFGLSGGGLLWPIMAPRLFSGPYSFPKFRWRLNRVSRYPPLMAAIAAVFALGEAGIPVRYFGRYRLAWCSGHQRCSLPHFVMIFSPSKNRCGAVEVDRLTRRCIRVFRGVGIRPIAQSRQPAKCGRVDGAAGN